MNGKQARNLRKLVEKEASMFPEKEYTTVSRKEKVVQVGFKADGSPHYEVVAPTAVELAECQRQLYQRAKALHHTFHGRN